MGYHRRTYVTKNKFIELREHIKDVCTSYNLSKEKKMFLIPRSNDTWINLYLLKTNLFTCMKEDILFHELIEIH